jgi:hypothetical protein
MLGLLCLQCLALLFKTMKDHTDGLQRKAIHFACLIGNLEAAQALTALGHPVNTKVEAAASTRVGWWWWWWLVI